MGTDIKILDVFVPVEEPRDVLSQHVWPSLCPSWTGKSLVDKTLAGGWINTIILFHTADDVEAAHGLVVRLHNNVLNTSQLKYDEFIHMQVAHHAGCFASVRAVLRNGIIYDYMPGRTLLPSDVTDHMIGTRLARAFAKLHWVDTKSIQVKDRTGKAVTFPEHDNYTKRMREVIEEFSSAQFEPEETARIAPLIKLVDLEREVDFIEKYLEGLDIPTANTHDDLHFWNALYDEKTGQVNFLDYEMSGYHGPATNDLSFILGLGGWSKDPITRFMPAEMYPDGPESDETKLMWLTAYLEEKHKIEGGGSDDVSEDEVKLWFTMLQITDVLHYLHHIIATLSGFLFTKSHGFLLAVYEVGLKEYHDKKPGLTALRQKYMDLKTKLHTHPISQQ